MADNYTWAADFRRLFDRCCAEYRAGRRGFSDWFGAADRDFLGSIGCGEQELFDFVEDHCRAEGDEPTPETALLVAAVRRDYFQVIQKGVPSGKVVPQSTLPPKPAELEGIPWLPRIIAKAEAKLRGELDADTMFGCGGDRGFCEKHGIHPADFLRVVWAAHGDTARIIRFVKTGRHE